MLEKQEMLDWCFFRLGFCFLADFDDFHSKFDRKMTIFTEEKLSKNDIDLISKRRFEPEKHNGFHQSLHGSGTVDKFWMYQLAIFHQVVEIRDYNEFSDERISSMYARNRGQLTLTYKIILAKIEWKCHREILPASWSYFRCW